jgi:hypothetical protein
MANESAQKKTHRMDLGESQCGEFIAAIAIAGIIPVR